MSSTGELPDAAPVTDQQAALTERLGRLEAEVVVMRAELRALRRGAAFEASATQGAQARSSAAHGAAAAQPQDASSPASSNWRIPAFAWPSLEELVGRYATLALGALTVIVGIGIFMGWAIRAGLLGPTVRVALGAVGAAALAALGMWLRHREYKDFGNAILALALAVVHLVSWSAGPLLHVVPPVIALAVAFLSSLVLAEFALRKHEQLLYCVGFGGAAVAPFVTSDSDASVVMLALYGVVVIGMASAALRDREWTIARRMAGAAFALYLIALVVGSSSGANGTSERLAAIAFALAFIALVVILGHRRYRPFLLRIGAGGLAIATFAFSTGSSDWMLALALAALGAVLAGGLLFLMQPVDASDAVSPANARRGISPSLVFIDGVALPALLMSAMIGIVPRGNDIVPPVLAIAWSAALVMLAVRSRGLAISNAYPLAASLAAIVAANELSLPLWGTAVALGVTGMGLAFVHTRVPRTGFVAGSTAALALASLQVLLAVHSRQPFNYTPFAEWSSLAGVAVLGAWIAATLLFASDDTLRRWLPVDTRTAATSAAALFTFFWIQGELDGAFSPAVSFALLVVYYGVTGFLAIEFGRRRRIPLLRVAGLALSILAAGKALLATMDVDDIGTRVGVLLVASVFLIGVAYRYRKYATHPPGRAGAA